MNYNDKTMTRMSILAETWSVTISTKEKAFFVIFNNCFFNDNKIYAREVATSAMMFLDKMFVVDSEVVDALMSKDVMLIRKPMAQMTDMTGATDMFTMAFDKTRYMEVIMTPAILITVAFMEDQMNFFRLNFEIMSENDMVKFIKMYRKNVMTPLSGKVMVNNDTLSLETSWFTKLAALKNTLKKLVINDISKKKAKVLEEDTVSLDTLVTSITQDKEKITKSVMRSFMKARHNYVCDVIMAELNLTATSSDVKMVETYGYTGLDYHLTPDFIYTKVDGDKPINYIVDVAVTKANVSTIADRKIAKYSVLADGFSMHLSQTVVPVALVISIKDSGEMVIPDCMSEFTDKMTEVQDKLMAVNSLLMVMPGYAEALFEFEKDVEEDTLSDRRMLLSELVDCYLKLTNLTDKKAVKLSDSFLTASTDFDTDVVTNNDDAMLAAIKNDLVMFNEDDYMASLFKDISAGIFNGKLPLMIKSLEEEVDYKELFDKEVVKAESIRSRFYNTTHKKVPKVFKFPYMHDIQDKDCPEFYDGIGRVMEVMNDGTRVIKQTFIETDDDKVVHREGFGFNMEEDKTVIDNLLKVMVAESSTKFRKMMEDRFPTITREMWSMMKMRVFEVCWNVSKLAKNITYLEGRRFVVKTGKAVFKKFEEDGYSLVICAGSRLTAESQIKYKMITEEEDQQLNHFHSTTMNECGYAETGWLAVSMTDMKTMLVMFEKAVAIASHYLDCWEESKKMKVTNLDAFFREDLVMIPIITMMEMKRATSTTAQYNRYIFNSMMGYMSDRKKMITDVMAEPVRSRLDAYYRIKQLEWSIELTKVAKSVWLDVMTKSMSTSSDYDSLMSPSMFSNGRLVEFSFIMNDMYLGNLFQKEAGFTSHRSKAIIAKMCKEEMHYLSVRNMDTMNSEMTVEDCFEKPDEKHTYSKDFIMAMGKRVAQKVKKSAKYEEIILDRVSRNMHDTMMMTYSLETCRVENKTIEVSTEQSTNITFLTMQKLTEEFGTSVTSQIVSKENVVEAIFSMFAKPQIGGPREILIQSYKTRLHVKFLENIMEGMCSIHEKEMLSKGAVKEDIQSSTSSEFKKTLILRAKKGQEVLHNFHADSRREQVGPVLRDDHVHILPDLLGAPDGDRGAHGDRPEVLLVQDRDVAEGAQEEVGEEAFGPDRGGPRDGVGEEGQRRLLVHDEDILRHGAGDVAQVQQLLALRQGRHDGRAGVEVRLHDERGAGDEDDDILRRPHEADDNVLQGSQVDLHADEGCDDRLRGDQHVVQHPHELEEDGLVVHNGRVQLVLLQGEEGHDGGHQGRVHVHRGRRLDRTLAGREGHLVVGLEGLQPRHVLEDGGQRDLVHEGVGEGRVLLDQRQGGGAVPEAQLLEDRAPGRPRLHLHGPHPRAVGVRTRHTHVQVVQLEGVDQVLQEHPHGLEGGVEGAGQQPDLDGDQRQDQNQAPREDGQDVEGHDRLVLHGRGHQHRRRVG